MKMLANCLITKKFLDNKTWDETSIHKRKVELSNIIFQIWGIKL